MRRMKKLLAALLLAALTLTLLAGCSTAEDRTYLNDLHEAYVSHCKYDGDMERTSTMDAKAQKVLGYLQSALTVDEDTETVDEAAVELLESTESEMITLLQLDLSQNGYYISVSAVPVLENGMYDKTRISGVAGRLYWNCADYYISGASYANSEIKVGYAIGKLNGKTIVVEIEAWPRVKD